MFVLRHAGYPYGAGGRIEEVVLELMLAQNPVKHE